MSTPAKSATLKNPPADPSGPSASIPSAATKPSDDSAVIDLTSNDTPEDSSGPSVTVTPPLQRPRKRTRASRRLEDLELKKNDLKPIGDDTPAFQPSVVRPCRKSNDGDTPQASDLAEDDPSHYYLVDEVLDRRTRKYGSETAGLRHVVEYLVSWKNPPGYTGDTPHYDPSWQLAENLDQHSLADAFKKFPQPADPHNGGDAKMKSEGENDVMTVMTDLDLDDFSEDEVEESDGEEEQEMNVDIIEEEEEEAVIKKPKDSSVTHLEESDYDSPGTVELVLNRRTYRVGQSFYSPEPTPQFIFTISIIKPMSRKALCARYMRMDKCFAAPKGKEDCYVMMKEDILVELTTLKTPCKEAFEIYPMKYEQSDDQRSFSFFNETGKIQYGTRKPTALDLFSGAGGFSLGLNAAGFDVRWAVDNDALAASTLRANKAKSSPGLRVFVEDVKTFLKGSIRGDPCYPKPGDVDHLHGSPPCKGFSRANRSNGKGKNDSSNNKQTLLFAKAINHFKPATCSYENVPTLVSESLPLHKEYLQTIVSQLLQLEYQVSAKVLTASDYGDPQRRRRLILVAARKDCLNVLFPNKTCKDALKHLEKHEPTTTKTCGSVMLGDTVTFNHVVPRHACSEHDWLLVKDEPSRTILAGAKPHRHYRGDRFISVREAALLQSFPFDYQFFGGISKQYSQVGNAVPVKLATAVSRCVAKAHDLA